MIEMSGLVRSDRGLRSGLSRRSTRNPLVQIVEAGNVQAARDMLQDQSRDTFSDHLDEALLEAAASGHQELCRMLLDTGASPNRAEATSSHLQRNDFNPALSPAQAQKQMWMERNTGVGGTSLHRAVENGHVLAADLLVQNGADVNVRDQNGVTSLILACMRRGNLDMVRMLTSANGCDVSMTEKRYGRSALHYACQLGDVEVVRHLIQEGAATDSYDNNGNTPLLLSVAPLNYEDSDWPRRQAARCVELILRSGCFVNVVNSLNETALMRAVEANDIESIEILLEYNAVVQFDILRHSCLVLKNSEIVNRLLTGSKTPINDEVLLIILVFLVSSQPSKWMLNNNKQEEQEHEVARELIKSIYNSDLIHNVLANSEQSTSSNFGSDFKNIKQDLIDDVTAFGLFGMALKHGKYGISRMLYLAGHDVTPMRKVRMSGLGWYLQQHIRLQHWLPTAISTPFSLKCQCRKVIRQICRKHVHNLKEKSIKAYLMMSDIDEIEPYDSTVRERGESLMDECYTARESSKVVKQQSLWLYC